MNRIIQSCLTIAVFLASVATAATLYGQVPVIQVTDLFCPFDDPDEYFDLAAQYALAYQGEVELKGIMIDYSRSAILDGREKRPIGDPDVIGVAMMNRITGKAVPVLIGSPHTMKDRNDVQSQASRSEHGGIDILLKILRESPDPVAIHILGSCRDIAIAGKKDPELFRKKCKAIYLNVGQAFGSRTEWNVRLDRFAYTAIFDLPCPIYWLPCYMGTKDAKGRWVWKGEYTAMFDFPQGMILPDLSPQMKNFFAYMFRGREAKEFEIPSFPANPNLTSRTHWLRYLDGPVDEDVIKQQAGKPRCMWSKPGFLHAIGKTVTTTGQIVPIEQAGDSAVFTFEPIRLAIANPGKSRVNWSPDPTSKDRFILHVTDTAQYEPAMCKALRSMLLSLP